MTCRPRSSLRLARLCASGNLVKQSSLVAAFIAMLRFVRACMADLQTPSSVLHV
jgi:hypothetical protein